MPNKLFIGEDEGFLPRSYGAGEVEALPNENPRLAPSCPSGTVFQENYRGWNICQIPPHIPVQPMPLYFAVKDSEETPHLPIIDMVKAIIDNAEGPDSGYDFTGILVVGGVFAVVLVGLFLFK